MEERGMNARIKALRRLSENTQAHIDMERAKSETETYKSMKESCPFRSCAPRY